MRNTEKMSCYKEKKQTAKLKGKQKTVENKLLNLLFWFLLLLLSQNSSAYIWFILQITALFCNSFLNCMSWLSFLSFYLWHFVLFFILLNCVCFCFFLETLQTIFAFLYIWSNIRRNKSKKNLSRVNDKRNNQTKIAVSEFLFCHTMSHLWCTE